MTQCHAVMWLSMLGRIRVSEEKKSHNLSLIEN